ncbi:ATP-binding protein [Streptomyces sp. NPDC088789]|uniref:ATP-binding protein n=1 Tax=Streptomyces sp. NPDC088789 TaxID=3365899 RepID=UPI003807C95C
MWASGGDDGPPLSPGGADGELIGREREAADLRLLLARHRLVTLAGGAGVGKSALAAAVPGTVPDPPWERVVRLGWIGDGTAVDGSLSAAASQALGIACPSARPEPEVPSRTTVQAAPFTAGEAPLHPLPVLLLLDGVDAVHGECVRLVQRLLTAVPALRVLVTSRRPLGLGAEQVLRPGPLAVDSPEGAPGGGPAVELFVARARPSIGTDSDLRTVAGICAALDGNPLAIELAAHQTTRHPLAELAELIAHGQCWLDAPVPGRRRKRSLRDSVGAGYELCERAERMVWARVSMFAGAFAEDAAVFLCAGGGVEPVRVPAALTRLAALGVLEPVEPAGGVRGPRYRMNRAAREFGLDRLRAVGEFAVAAERRMVHCRSVATVAGELWDRGDQSGAARVVLDDEADVTAMIRHAFSQPAHAETALEAVVRLWFWWVVYGRGAEGRSYVLRLLPLCEPEGPTAVRARVLAAWLCAAEDPDTARTLLGHAWPRAVRLGDAASVGRISHVEGLLALREGDPLTAARHFEAAAEVVPAGAPDGPPGAVSRAAAAIVLAGRDPGAARRAARRALAAPGIRDDAWARLVARHARALVDRRLGRTARARQRARRALDGLDAGLPEPLGGRALRQLVTDIERGRAGSARDDASSWCSPTSHPRIQKPCR